MELIIPEFIYVVYESLGLQLYAHSFHKTEKGAQAAIDSTVREYPGSRENFTIDRKPLKF